MYVGKVFEKRITYVGNDVDLWEMAKKCGKWHKCLTNALINWEMTEIWEMIRIFGKFLRYGARFEYLRFGISIL